MGTLTRRALFGAAGLFAIGPLARSGDTATAAQRDVGEQVREHGRAIVAYWVNPPKDGHTFCDACAGEDWPQRFGAYTYGGVDSPERMRYDVMEGDEKLQRVMAVVPGPGGWVAELTESAPYVNLDGEVLRFRETCICGSGHFRMRVRYSDDVHLIDGWNDGAIIP